MRVFASMRSKILLGVIVAISCASFASQKASAVSPAEVSDCINSSASRGAIDAQRRVCEDGPSQGARGALWFNNTLGEPFNPKVTIEDPTAETIKVYIRGDIYTWDNNRGSMQNPITVKAVNIEVQDPAITIDGPGPHELDRGTIVGLRRIWNDAYGGAANYLTATLHIPSFKASIPDCGDASRTCSKRVPVDRCWYDSGSLGGCGTDEVLIELEFSAALVPESWIGTDGINFAKTDIFAAPGDTVYFKHNYRKTGTGVIAPCEWWIYQSSSNGAANNSLAAGIPTDGNSLSPPSRSDCLNQNILTSDGNLLNTIRGPRIEMPFKIPDNAQDGWRWCQRAAYRPLENGTNRQAEPRVCVEVKVDDEEEEPPVIASCPLPNSAYSVNKGGTQAGSAVRNITASAAWVETTETNHNAIVWAKPGDSVQFRHTLCFGAQAVRGSTAASPAQGSTVPTIANTATIRAFTTPASAATSNYLFGSTLTGTHSQTFNLGTANPTPAAVASADSRGSYFFTFNSPSSNAGTKYKCQSSSASFPAFKSPGYQIPNFTPDIRESLSGCNSVAPSDVGKIIEQDLEWNNVQSWINTASIGGSATCGCTPSIIPPTINTAPTYDQAPPAGQIGTHVIGCQTGTEGCCGCCWPGCLPGQQGPATVKYEYWYYPQSTATAAAPTKKAQVKIPFNYTTTTSVTVPNNNGVLYGGEDVRVDASVKINPRGDNPDIDGTYSTISKPSVYEIVSFTIPAEPLTSAPGHLQGNASASGSKDTRACSYYTSSIAGARCQSIRREDSVFNASGNITNPSADTLLNLYLNIPDVEVGTKFCVALGVWPSDSHDSLSAPTSNDIAMTTSNPGTWNYSKASCITIAKKPSVQFWGQSIYTAGRISTSASKKNLNHNILGNNNPCTFASYTSATSGNCGTSTLSNGGSRNVYGSWSEYDTIALGSIRNFATGAGYGYERNNGGTLATPGGYPNVNFSSGPNTCVYSSQTFSNDQCASNAIGNAAINNVGLDTALSRITSRYISPSAPAKPAGTIIDLQGACVPQSGNSYAPTAGNYACLDNGTKYAKVNGDAILNAPICLDNGVTSVIDVSGTLYIRGNIVYGTGPSCAPATYSDISSLPQQLIFAGKINIANSVTRIDSWLIAGNGNGEINTCSDVADRPTAGQLSANVCANPLAINGPVFASRLYLNRTAGALPGNGSIQAAETFNLRPDTYLWSYSQAQRFSQAVTTYSRELAPRF